MTTIANKRILVTGGTGFIGSHLVRRLIYEGAKVTIFERPASDHRRIRDVLPDVKVYEIDIRAFGQVNAAISKVQPEIVYHLAAEGVNDPFLSPNLALRVNLDGTINVIRGAATAGAKRIIHTGTSYEYGDLSQTGQLDPISPYAASKAAAWAFSRMYHRTMNWPIVCLRLFQVYGPGQSGTLIPSAIEAGLKGQNFATTAGEQVRDWIYVDDVIEAYLQAAVVDGIEGKSFDVGTGTGTSVRDVVELIFQHFFDENQLQIGVLPYRPGEVWSLIAETEIAREQLRWQASTSLKDGLKKTVAEQRSGYSTSLTVPVEIVESEEKDADQRINALRGEILDKVTEYYSLAHRKNGWEPGKSRVQYAGRVFDDQEIRNMTDSVLEFWLTAGRYAEAFEKKLGNFLGVREVIPVNSGSSANLVAMATLRSKQLRSEPLKAGDEVITTAVTFPTTLAPILQNGLIPVLVDSRLGDYNIDVEQLEAALSPKTRAIFAAHTLGNPIDMDVLMRFAQEHDLYVIEDNCDALGSTFDGKMTGTFGDLATSSFYPAHHITLGEGGAVYTNSPLLAKIARTIRDWGRDCWCGYTNPPNGQCGRRFEWQVPGMEGLVYDHRYLFTEIGYNLKLTDPQAAVGVAQMDKLPDFVAGRKRNFRLLYNGLQPLEEYFILPTTHPKADPSWFAFPLTIRPGTPFNRTELQRFLENRLIETRLLFAGNILKQPGYQNIPHRAVGDLPVAALVMTSTFFVGVYPGLGEQQIEYIREAFYDFLKSKGLGVR